MDFITLVASTVAVTDNATYSCVFTNNWTKKNHPVEFPDNAHWSPRVFVSHNEDYQMWAPGVTASNGVELVAETGGTSTIQSEVEDAQDDGSAKDFVIGTEVDIMLSSEFPLLSTITMIAPSPDWFSGFYDFSPIDTDVDGNDVWLQSFEIATYPWDAGTEAGTTYSLNNDDEDAVIMELTEETLPSTDNGIFLNKGMKKVKPVAFWTCELKGTIDDECVDKDIKFNNKNRKNCDWVGEKKMENTRFCKKKWGTKRLSKLCPNACGLCAK